jgi:hypothetical protein
MENLELRYLKILMIIFAFGLSHALDPMHNYRYTLGPEILVPDQFNIGLGAWTHRNEDLSIVSNAQVGLTNKFEVGLKYILGTNDEWIISKSRERSHTHSLLDVGAKYAISEYTALQADVPMSLNKDWEWGGIISFTQWNGYTRNVFSIYEARLGFGGASGPENHVKLSTAYALYFQLGSAFRISICPIGSASFENFKNDSMLDVQPRIEAGFSLFRIMAEVSRGILTYDADKHNRYALFVVSDI